MEYRRFNGYYDGSASADNDLYGDRNEWGYLYGYKDEKGPCRADGAGFGT